MARLCLAACLAFVGAGCSGDDPDPAVAPTPSASATSTASPTAPPERTIEMRYRVKPRSSKLFQVRLPPQQPGGTLITWSTFFQGIGAAASSTAPLKAECYVVQATSKRFEDRVLYVADDSSVSTGYDVSLSGAGLVDTADGTRLVFECEIDENSPDQIPGLRWQTHPQQPIQVTLTPVEHERREVTIK